MSDTTYNTKDEAWEAGNEWVRESDRWEKVDFLEETCSADFLQENLLREIVKFMGEQDFKDFFNHLRRNWGILTPQELDYEMHLFS